MIIEIIKVPFGFAPLWVRSNWVGLKMTAQREFKINSGYDVLGPQSDKVLQGRERKVEYYMVEKTVALKALATKSPRAAQWFEKNLNKGTLSLAFGADEVKVFG